MSYLSISPLRIHEMVVHFLELLPEKEIFENRMVCKAWEKAAVHIHTFIHRPMFDRIIKVNSPAELAAKTGTLEYDPKKCPCKLVKKLIQSQKEEIDLLNAFFDSKYVEPIPKHKVDADHPENFFLNRQNIKDHNLGAGLYLKGHFGEDRADNLEMGKEARKAIESEDKNKLAESFNNSTLLETLRLFFDHCGLTEFPIEICLSSKMRKTRLVNLDLEKNHISYLPEEINLFPDLLFLNLSENAFRLFPKTILVLKKLESLNLHHNPLTAIPPEIVQLDKLLFVDFSFTSITSLPNEIASLPNLEIIKLSGTQIQSFPKEIMLCNNQALVNAMIPHLFGELVFSLCTNNRQKLYELICLLSKKNQNDICLFYHEYNRDFDSRVLSLEDFLNAIQKKEEISEASLLSAFMGTLRVIGIDTTTHASEFWVLWNNLKKDLAQWTP
ncbi:MAG TPA: leucine-rich repeat domain-containing protein, partial [Rhabdochlamydiaceae bacterium]|nr:leucine-rich repeat domain-containing protein [Rhabdochlamydiaceae bacterium]